MIVVRLKGGLGNQLFQYAFGYVLAQRNHDNLKMDIEWFDTEGNVPWLAKRSYELDKFQIPSAEIIRHKDIPFIPRLLSSRIVRRLFALLKIDNIKLSNWLVVATTSAFNYMHLPESKNVLLNGYFDNHAAVYLNGYLEGLRAEFQEKQCSEATKKLVADIKNESNTTSIHVRRTDQMHATGHLADLEYYKKAIEYIREKEPETVFYVFSDDIDWCKETFAEYPSMIFATDKSDSDPMRDFIGMMNCKNNIIAYSTYSWWAAMLNQHKDKLIISPKFYDSVESLPDEWVVL